MEYQTTIEADNCIKHITIKPALYMDLPLWEVTIDDTSYIVRRSQLGYYQCTDSSLSVEILNKIGGAIEVQQIKDAG
jgi:hypothetical protein